MHYSISFKSGLSAIVTLCSLDVAANEDFNWKENHSSFTHKKDGKFNFHYENTKWEENQENEWLTIPTLKIIFLYPITSLQIEKSFRQITQIHTFTTTNPEDIKSLKRFSFPFFFFSFFPKYKKKIVILLCVKREIRREKYKIYISSSIKRAFLFPIYVDIVVAIEHQHHPHTWTKDISKEWCVEVICKLTLILIQDAMRVDQRQREKEGWFWFFTSPQDVGESRNSRAKHKRTKYQEM